MLVVNPMMLAIYNVVRWGLVAGATKIYPKQFEHFNYIQFNI